MVLRGRGEGDWRVWRAEYGNCAGPEKDRIKRKTCDDAMIDRGGIDMSRGARGVARAVGKRGIWMK